MNTFRASGSLGDFSSGLLDSRQRNRADRLSAMTPREVRSLPQSVSIFGLLRVLVVSPSLETRSIVRQAVDQEPLLESQFAECESLEAAKARVIHQGFDLIVLDTSLDDVRWLAANGNGDAAAIVYLSRLGTLAEQGEAVAAGAIDSFVAAEYAESPELLWVGLRQSIRYHAMKRHRKQLEDVVRDRDIQVVQLTQRLFRASPVDHRTGWLNHSQIVERLHEELRRAARYRLPLCVVQLEMLGLADAEARWGRGAATQILAQLGQRTRRVTRLTDIVGHYGADSLFFLLTNTSMAGARRFCERLSKTLKEGALVNGREVELDWRLALVDTDGERLAEPAALLGCLAERIERAKSVSDTGALVAE